MKEKGGRVIKIKRKIGEGKKTEKKGGLVAWPEWCDMRGGVDEGMDAVEYAIYRRRNSG